MHSNGDGHIRGLARRHSSPSQGHEASCMVTVEQCDIFATGFRPASVSKRNSCSGARCCPVYVCHIEESWDRTLVNLCSRPWRRVAVHVAWIVYTMAMAGKTVSLK